MSQFDTSTTRPEEPTTVDSPSSPTFEGLADALKKGLFKDAKNTILTVVFASVLVYSIYRASIFLFANQKVTTDGTFVNSWRVIDENLQTFMVGAQFNQTGITIAALWIAVYLAAFTLGFAVGPERGVEIVPMKARTKFSIIAPPVVGALVIMNWSDTWNSRLLLLALPLAFLVGFHLVKFLPEAILKRKVAILVVLGIAIFMIETGGNPANVDKFGGLLLTINAAFISIIACFPIGVVLALARRSSFPLIRPLSVAYIELIRGVPLISLLFMGAFALTLFLPPGMDGLPKTIRSIIMITLFSAAYVAEIVRGGLQSVHSGQTEAGQAVGLSPITITRRIVLPQALRNSIPALVGQFIALLKDTTLLIIVGQRDLLGVSAPLLQDDAYRNQGYAPEVYAFVAFIFWIMTFSMSRASQRLETKLGVGTR